MKQCFAFCAVFPKDYQIDVEVLIQLWMAHDFIPLKEGENLEMAGREIFDELTWRLFFQDVRRDPERVSEHLRSRTVCNIHDLMHDIALSVMGQDCVTIVNSTDKELLSAGLTRHMFGAHYHDYLFKHPLALHTLIVTKYYTLGSEPHLSLRALRYRFVDHPRPRHLLHLRYLDLSESLMVKLPKKISMLYNLQTLNLSQCKHLVRLPKDMKYMRNLRHLYTNGCTSLECMPPDLGQLTSLQTLTYFVVGSSAGCSTVGELRELNIGGELVLSRLDYVTEEHAKASSLGNKEKLTHLSLAWSSDSIEKLNHQRNVLDALKPHAGLQFLRISSYRGAGFPSWVTSLAFLQHLTELHLDGCTSCEEFPQFGQFKSLEVLILKRLNKLQSLCSRSSSAAFPALKRLALKNLDIFERWVATGEELTFPLLENVNIKNCPKLATLPEARKLKVIKLKEDKAQLSSLIFRSRHMSCLSEIFLSVSDTEATPELKLDQDPEVSISVTRLRGCTFLFPSSPLQPTVEVWKWFGQLVDLKLEYCDVLISWPEEEFQSLVSLTCPFSTAAS
jgi:hypothetical protein